MKEKAIIQTVSITKKSEIKHFEVRIPRDANFITGVETSVRMIDAFDGSIAFKLFPLRFGFEKSTLIGELRLKSNEEANQFYSKDIVERNRNLDNGDFSETVDFRALPFSHSEKSAADEVKVSGDTTVVYGVYRDHIGKTLDQNLHYEIKIILWYERKEQNQNQQQ